MKINIYVIDKKGKKELYDPLIEHYLKSCRQWADVQVHEIHSKAIAKAHDVSSSAAQKSYTEAFEKSREGGYAIALDPSSRQVDSEGFANLLKDRGVIHFYIGGAYGLERDFIAKCNNAISLGKITLSHKLIKVVLAEQVFRGLSILHNHPYHK